MLPVAMPMMRSWTNFVMEAFEAVSRESNEWLVERQYAPDDRRGLDEAVPERRS